MALVSMTGFGRGEARGGGVKVTVELSAVNRKQFDCSVSMPRELGSLEASLHALIHTRVARGYVKGLVTVSAAAEAEPGGGLVDVGRVGAQVEALRAVAARLGLADDLTASALLRLPDVWRARSLSDDPAGLWPWVEEAARAALDALCEMRLREGEAIGRDLRQRFGALRVQALKVGALAPRVPQAYRETLSRRLSELLGQGAAADPALVAREVAVFADRCDVSEELTRLASHLDQVERTLDVGGACGRTLDFLCQELFREINTTGSKANDAEIAACVIAFKAGLEAAREQVQNIE